MLISLELIMHYHLENPESRTFRDAPGIQLCIQDSKRQRTPGLNKCVVGAHGDTLGRMKSHADFDTFSHNKLDQSGPPCTITAWSRHCHSMDPPGTRWRRNRVGQMLVQLHSVLFGRIHFFRSQFEAKSNQLFGIKWLQLTQGPL